MSITTTRFTRQAKVRILFLMITISIALPWHFSSWLDLSARASTNIVVNSTADTVANDGQCTLREAITAANTDTASGALAGECLAGSGADIIKFAISGSGVQTIIPLTSLPSISDPGAQRWLDDTRAGDQSLCEWTSHLSRWQQRELHRGQLHRH